MQAAAYSARPLPVVPDMQTPAAFARAGFLAQLQAADPAVSTLAGLELLQTAGGGHAPTATGNTLLALLQAWQRLDATSVDVGLVADELRRYQKFAAPGRPSLQIVQLRRQQSTVQQAQRVARQEFIRCADAFARAAALTVPPKLGVAATVERWLAANLPADRD